MKTLFSLFLVAVLATSVIFGQEFDLKIQKYHSDEVNRKDGILATNVYVKNDMIIKDLKFDILIEYINCENFKALPIPAECFKSDGANDPSKWTDTSSSNGLFAFHYWMDQSTPSHFLEPSSQSRKIMGFFLKTKKTIPFSGSIKMTFSNFVITDLNGASVSFKESRSITIELGNLPSPDFNLQLSSIKVARTEVLNNLSLDLEYSGKAFDSLSADLILPTDWSKPVITPSIADVSDLGGGKWRLAMAAKMPASGSGYKKLFTMTLNFPAHSKGQAKVVMNGITVKDSSKTLTGPGQLEKVIDIGNPFISPNKETVKLLPDPSRPILTIDQYKKTGNGELVTSILVNDTIQDIKYLEFVMSLPNYITLYAAAKELQFGIVTKLTTVGGRTTYKVVLEKSTGAWPANASTDNPKKFCLLSMLFTDMEFGVVQLQVHDIIMRNAQGQIVNLTKSFNIDVDTKQLFSSLKKGDVNFNFGDGLKSSWDAQQVIDFLSGKFKDPSYYQRWAMDYNGDGVINKKDVDDYVRDLAGTTSVEDDLSSPNEVIFTSYGEVLTAEEIVLVVYSPTGEITYKDDHVVGRELTSLQNGLYFWQAFARDGHLIDSGSIAITNN